MTLTRKVESVGYSLQSHKLFAEYSTTYSSILLPRIARDVLGLKFTSSMILFTSRLKMYDPVTIEKQNNLIKIIKIKNIFNQKIKQPYCQNSTLAQSINVNDKNKLSLIKRLSLPGQVNELKIYSNRKSSCDYINGLSDCKQYYEYERILKQRLDELSQFILILKQSKLFYQCLQKIQQQLQKEIFQTAQKFYKILKIKNKSDKHHFTHGQHVSSNFFNLSLKNSNAKGLLIKKNGFNNHDKYQSNQSDKQNLQKCTFLKKKSSNDVSKKAFQSKFTKMKKIIPQQFNKQFEAISNRAQISYKFLSDKSSKKTQQLFEQDLQEDNLDDLFDNSNWKYKEIQSQKVFRSQTRKKTGPKTLKNMTTTCHQLINQQEEQFKQNRNSNLSQSSNQSFQKSSQKSSQKSLSLSPSSKVDVKGQYQITCPTSRQITTTKRGAQPQTQRKSIKIISQKSHSQSSNQSLTSRSSIRANKLKIKNHNIYGMNQNANTQKQRLNNLAIKKGQHPIKGGRKGIILQTKIEQSQSPSPSPSIANQNQFIRKKGRRDGKAIKINMNEMFSRMIQDDSIKIMIQKKQSVQNAKITKKRFHDRQTTLLKRAKTSTDTSIVAASGDIAQQYFKSHIRLKKPSQLVIGKDTMTANYSQLITLQQNLKPIAAYNEAKMITKYSNEKYSLKDFQLKHKNGRLVFNHQFYVRNQQLSREDQMEEQIKRVMNNKKQESKFDFMLKFRKCLEGYDEPVQIGFEKEIDSNNYLKLGF